MSLLRIVVAMILGAAVATGVVNAAARPDYAAGQVWEYRTRPGDEGSLLKIQQVEQAALKKLGPIYHISIIGVHLGGRAGTTVIMHSPVSRATLDASVTRLSHASTPFPDPGAGIAQWRAAGGGVFTIPVAKIVGTIDHTIRSGSPPGQ